MKYRPQKLVTDSIGDPHSHFETLMLPMLGLYVFLHQPDALAGELP